MKKTIFLFTLVLFGVIVFSLTQGVAAGDGKASILFKEGDVRARHYGTAAWMAAPVGKTLSRGDSLRTGPGSWAEIETGKDSANIVRLEENTYCEFTELGPVVLGLLKGRLRTLVEKIDSTSSFTIKTPTAVCGARGTGWDTALSGEKTIVDVFEKKVFFYPADPAGRPLAEETTILSGKRGILDDPAQAVRIEKVPPASIKGWKAWKKDFKKRNSSGKGLIPALIEKIRRFKSAHKKKIKKPAQVRKDIKRLEERTDSKSR